MINKFLDTLLAKNESRSPLFWMTGGLGMIILIFVFCLWTKNELSFSAFYLMPIILVAWFSGRRYGLMISVISAISWVTVDILVGGFTPHPLVSVWNATVRLSFFVLVALLIPYLRDLAQEKDRAHIDDLTGIANRRRFFEVAQAELDRSQRYRRPFTVAYIDIDNLKIVNDRWGHRMGDELLCAFAAQAARLLRKTDTIARVGGDEFILMFPETDQAAAQMIISRMQATINHEMERNHWPVTFSIGVLTCENPSLTADELIRRADKLMYSVKNNGKNAIAYGVYAGEPAEGSSSTTPQTDGSS